MYVCVDSHNVINVKKIRKMRDKRFGVRVLMSWIHQRM